MDNSEGTNALFAGDGNVTSDGSGPLSRSSVTHVAYIFSKFNDAKRDLVREIGFGGILELPQITKVDRKFTLWLLSNLDPEKRCIVVNNQCVTDIVDFEVGRIMGIPCGNRKVCPLESADRKSKFEFIQNFIGITSPESNSLAAAENKVTATYEMPMTLKDQDNFKVSFVVWVMGHLLAPTKKHNFGGDRFWGGLLSPQDISEFNWAEFVLEELCLAAKDVQTSIKEKKPINAIFGCSILLQIVYFEAINMGNLNRPRGTLPRVKVYDSKSLALMIAADKEYSVIASTNLRAAKDSTAVPSDNIQSGPLISNFGTFIRDMFGDQVSPQQAVALSWFHARCTQQCQQFRLRLQQDTIDLVDKLFSNREVAIHPKPPRPNYIGVQVRQAHSEPSRPPIYSRRTQNYKRGCESSSNINRRHATKKQLVPSRKFELPETLLSGMSRSNEHEVTDAISDNEDHSRDMNHRTHVDLLSKGCGSEVPVAVVGLEENNKTHGISHNNGLSAGHIHFAGQSKGKAPVDTTTPNILNANLDLASSSGADDHCMGSSTPNSVFKLLTTTPPSAKLMQAESSGGLDIPLFDLGIELNNEIQDLPYTAAAVEPKGDTMSESIYPDVSKQINELSCRSDVNDSCVGSATSVSSFNSIPSSPTTPKTMDPHTLAGPDIMIKSSSKSPGSLTKIIAEGDLVERMTRLEDSPNMNLKPWDHDYIDSPIVKRKVDGGNTTQSPWHFNCAHRSPPTDIVEKLFQDISLASSFLFNRVWLAHTSPRHIELDGSYIHATFIKGKALSYDLCDLAVRRLKQLDEMMYPDSSHPHWRHILESEFAMLALAGEPAYCRKSIMEQFIGSSIKYKIQDCQMVVVPAFVLLNWSCYFFDIKKKFVYVIDPLYKKAQSDFFSQLHHPSVSKISACLDNCFDMYFLDWHHDMLSWDVGFLEAPITDATPEETGLLTLLYLRQFDGSEIQLVNREYFKDFKKLMLYELMCLSDNHIKAPVPITIAIND